MHNFACNLKAVGGYENLLAFALDEEALSWGQATGLPVVHIPTISDRSKGQIHYGTPRYKTVTKLKSLSTLKVLEMGFSVIFSDPDVVWYANPFRLVDFRTADVVIQSDSETKRTITRHPNSGLYFVSASERTLGAFRAIVIQAKKQHGMSEQPNFRTVLCMKRVRARCFYSPLLHNSSQTFMPDSSVTTTDFLPLESFPNGGFRIRGGVGVFDLTPAEFESATGKPLLAAHCNYIVGVKAKIKQLQAHGDWHLMNGKCIAEQ